MWKLYLSIGIVFLILFIYSCFDYINKNSINLLRSEALIVQQDIDTLVVSKQFFIKYN